MCGKLFKPKVPKPVEEPVEKAEVAAEEEKMRVQEDIASKAQMASLVSPETGYRGILSSAPKNTRKSLLI